jgi:hypothetical protein
MTEPEGPGASNAPRVLAYFRPHSRATAVGTTGIGTTAGKSSSLALLQSPSPSPSPLDVAFVPSAAERLAASPFAPKQSNHHGAMTPSAGSRALVRVSTLSSAAPSPASRAPTSYTITQLLTAPPAFDHVQAAREAQREQREYERSRLAAPPPDGYESMSLLGRAMGKEPALPTAARVAELEARAALSPRSRALHDELAMQKLLENPLPGGYTRPANVPADTGLDRLRRADANVDREFRRRGVLGGTSMLRRAEQVEMLNVAVHLRGSSALPVAAGAAFGGPRADARSVVQIAAGSAHDGSHPHPEVGRGRPTIRVGSHSHLAAVRHADTLLKTRLPEPRSSKFF